MTELVNIIFHKIKISNFRQKLAFKQVVRFKVPQYSYANNTTYFIDILIAQLQFDHVPVFIVIYHNFVQTLGSLTNKIDRTK